MISIIIRQPLIFKKREFILPVFLFILGIIYFKNSQNHKETKKSFDEAECVRPDHEEIQEYTSSLEELEHIPLEGATVNPPGDAAPPAVASKQIVNNRRSIRSFKNNSIPYKVIETCIRTAGTTPFGVHTDPWTFCVISDSTVKARVRKIIEDEEYLNYTKKLHRSQWNNDLRPLRSNHIKEYLTEAPYLILVFKQIYGYKADRCPKLHYNEISISIAVGILLSALQAAGLNSLVTTPLNCGPALRTLLNRPLNEKLVVLLPVGSASEYCKIPYLKKNQFKDNLVKY